MKDTGHLRLEPVVDVLSFAQPHIYLNESQSHSVGGFGKDNVPKIYFKKSPASFSVLMFHFNLQSESGNDLEKLNFLLSSVEKDAK